MYAKYHTSNYPLGTFLACPFWRTSSIPRTRITFRFSKVNSKPSEFQLILVVNVIAEVLDFKFLNSHLDFGKNFANSSR